ncbi:MAG: fluoride efflux transporter CrcB [Vampirovibrionales bacterium]|nr:fluoride efflux transporter CrcB [Vampirovibrionales bacterium]
MNAVWLLMLGGCAGTLSRYYVGRWAQQAWGAHWPYGTLLVNLCGCLLIGAALAFSEQTRWFPAWARILAVSGFLGALTTFSTLELEALLMARDGQWGRMAAYLGVSVACGLALAWLGYVVSARLIRLSGSA